MAIPAPYPAPPPPPLPPVIRGRRSPGEPYSLPGINPTPPATMRPQPAPAMTTRPQPAPAPMPSPMTVAPPKPAPIPASSAAAGALPQAPRQVALAPAPSPMSSPVPLSTLTQKVAQPGGGSRPATPYQGAPYPMTYAAQPPAAPAPAQPPAAPVTPGAPVLNPGSNKYLNQGAAIQDLLKQVSSYDPSASRGNGVGQMYRDAQKGFQAMMESGLAGGPGSGFLTSAARGMSAFGDARQVTRDKERGFSQSDFNNTMKKLNAAIGVHGLGVKERQVGAQEQKAQADINKSLKGDLTNRMKDILSTMKSTDPSSEEYKTEYRKKMMNALFKNKEGEFERVMRNSTLPLEERVTIAANWLRHQAGMTDVKDSEVLASMKIFLSGDKGYWKSYGEKEGEARRENVGFSVDAVNGGLGRVDQLEGQLDKIKDRGGTTGPFAGGINEAKKMFGVVANEIGWSIPDFLKSNPDIEIFQANADAFVTQVLKSTMGARPSDKDLEFLVRTMARLGASPEANRRLIDGMRQQMIGGIQKNLRFLDADWEIEDKKKKMQQVGAHHSRRELTYGYEQYMQKRYRHFAVKDDVYVSPVEKARIQKWRKDNDLRAIPGWIK